MTSGRKTDGARPRPGTVSYTHLDVYKRQILTIAAALSSLSMAAEKVTVDSSIKPYAPTSGVSGNLSAVGSDTLNRTFSIRTNDSVCCKGLRCGKALD